MKNGINTIKGNQTEARECYMNTQRKAVTREVNMVMVDIEMVNDPKKSKPLVTKKRYRMVEAHIEGIAPEEGAMYDELDPLIIEFNSQTNPVEGAWELVSGSPKTPPNHWRFEITYT